MNLSSLSDVLADQLKDLYSAESQLVKALPKIASRASSPALKQAIKRHLEETRGHVERLEEAGELLDCKLTGKKCGGMEGLLGEGEEALAAKGAGSLIDAAIVAAAQRVEHYEIAAYGAARTIAQVLGSRAVAKLLQQTLEEEKAANKKLTEIVENDVYPEALQVNAKSAANRNGHSSNRLGSTKAKRATARR
jgi:ferritin-like metal-binding protein YciE